jgi:hypothetical protein
VTTPSAPAKTAAPAKATLTVVPPVTETAEPVATPEVKTVTKPTPAKKAPAKAAVKKAPAKTAAKPVAKVLPSAAAKTTPAKTPAKPAAKATPAPVKKAPAKAAPAPAGKLQRKVFGKTKRADDLETHVSLVTLNGTALVDVRDFVPSLGAANGYGRGYTFSVDLLQDVLDGLVDLRDRDLPPVEASNA